MRGHGSLVAGATGYIGRRLVTEHVSHGERVRCLARSPHKLDGEPWREHVEVAHGDVLDASTLADGFVDVDVAYYLVHSIGSGERLGGTRSPGGPQLPGCRRGGRSETDHLPGRPR